MENRQRFLTALQDKHDCKLVICRTLRFNLVNKILCENQNK